MKTDKELLAALLYRLPVVAPVVWLAWFAAKQYGYASRLSEDYAYKAASAMAFEGYKRESTDDATKLKLLETAINNFGDNPMTFPPFFTCNHRESSCYQHLLSFG